MIKLKNIVFWQKVIREIYFILESVKPKASVRKHLSRSDLYAGEQAQAWGLS